MSRRTKAEMTALRDAILAMAEENQPCTVRQLYYLGIGRYWDKDSGGSRTVYNKTVCRLVGEMRESGDLPWEWIADNTRWFRKRTMFNSPEHVLADVASSYRRDLWAQQPLHVEVWCESDSIAGVIDDITYPLGVALFPCRGHTSKTLVREAVQSYQRIGKPVIIIYCGDWDPTGLAIPFSVEDRMARYANDVELDVVVHRVAVTALDIRSGRFTSHSVNTRDPNYERFVDHCRRMDLAPQTAVEVEALPPAELRERLSRAIDTLVDAQVWNAALAAEESERDLLQRMVSGDVSAYEQLVAP